MKTIRRSSLTPLAAALALGSGSAMVSALEPCGDFGECKVLIEINASDGDIGFHFLINGDDLRFAKIKDPNGTKIFQYSAKGALREQTMTETFAESAEPLCFDPLEDDEEDD